MPHRLGKLMALPRTPLAHLPTPVEAMENLSAHAGDVHLYVKIWHGAGILVQVLQGQVAAIRIALQQALPFQVAGHAVGDRVQEDLQLFGSGRRNLSKAQFPFVRLDVNTIQKEHMKMDRAAFGLRFSADPNR